MRRVSKELREARELLEQIRSEPLEMEGGYPAIVFGEAEGCTVIVWATRDGQPSVELISDADLCRWYRRAALYKGANPLDSWWTAMRETEGNP